MEVLGKPRFGDAGVFCEFLLNGHRFYVEEPYGDNSTYDVVAPGPCLKELDLKGGDLGSHLCFLARVLGAVLLAFAMFRAVVAVFAG